MSEPGPYDYNAAAAHCRTVKINNRNRPSRSAGDSSDGVKVVPDMEKNPKKTPGNCIWSFFCCFYPQAEEPS